MKYDIILQLCFPGGLFEGGLFAKMIILGEGLFELGAYSDVGAYSRIYGKVWKQMKSGIR